MKSFMNHSDGDRVIKAEPGLWDEQEVCCDLQENNSSGMAGVEATVGRGMDGS